jgi:hypothetical protein
MVETAPAKNQTGQVSTYNYLAVLMATPKKIITFDTVSLKNNTADIDFSPKSF